MIMLNLHFKISKASLWLGMMCFSFKLTFFFLFQILFSGIEWHESGHGSALSSHFNAAFDVLLKTNTSNISVSINKLTVDIHFKVPQVIIIQYWWYECEWWCSHVCCNASHKLTNRPDIVEAGACVLEDFGEGWTKIGAKPERKRTKQTRTPKPKYETQYSTCCLSNLSMNGTLTGLVFMRLNILVL